MKKTFSFILVIALILILCASLIACNTDQYSLKDNNNDDDVNDWTTGDWTEGIEVSNEELSYSQSTKNTIKSTVKNIVDTLVDNCFNSDDYSSASETDSENDEIINEITDIIIEISQKASLSETALINAATLTNSNVPSIIIRWTEDGTWGGGSYDYESGERTFTPATNPLNETDINKLNKYYADMLEILGEDAIGQIVYQCSIYALNKLIESANEAIELYNDGISDGDWDISEITYMISMLNNGNYYGYDFDDMADAIATLRYYAQNDTSNADEYNEYITQLKNLSTDELDEEKDAIETYTDLKNSVEKLTAKEFIIASRLGFAALNAVKQSLIKEGAIEDIADVLENVTTNDDYNINANDIIQYFKDYRNTLKEAKLDSEAFSAIYNIIGDLIKLVPSISYLNEITTSDDIYARPYNINVINTLYNKITSSDLEFMYNLIANTVCNIDDDQLDALSNYIFSSIDEDHIYLDDNENEISEDEYFAIRNSYSSYYIYKDNNNNTISYFDYKKVTAADTSDITKYYDNNGNEISYSKYYKKYYISMEEKDYDSNGVEISEDEMNLIYDSFSTAEMTIKDSNNTIIGYSYGTNEYKIGNQTCSSDDFYDYLYDANNIYSYTIEYYDINNELLTKLTYSLVDYYGIYTDGDGNTISKAMHDKLTQSYTSLIQTYYDASNTILGTLTIATTTYDTSLNEITSEEAIMNITQNANRVDAVICSYDGAVLFDGYCLYSYYYDEEEITASEYYAYSQYTEEVVGTKYYDGNDNEISESTYDYYQSIENDYSSEYTSTMQYYDGNGNIITQDEYNKKYNYSSTWVDLYYDGNGNIITEEQYDQIEADTFIALCKIYKLISSDDLNRMQTLFESLALTMNAQIKAYATNDEDFVLETAENSVTFDQIKSELSALASIDYGTDYDYVIDQLDALVDDLENYIYTLAPYFVSIL